MPAQLSFKPFAVILGLVLLVACSTPKNPLPNSEIPQLTQTLPVHNATGVALTTTIDLNFSRAMDSTRTTVTITPAVDLGEPLWDNPTRVSFSPIASLTTGTEYTVQVSGFGVNGVALITSFSFTTVTLTIPATHPKILLNNSSEFTRLKNKLSGSSASAVRFKTLVDRAVAGETIYGYEGWWSALVGALTTQPQYCTDAVNRGEAWIASETEHLQQHRAGNSEYPSPTQVAGDSYLEAGAIIGNLMLIYDYCFNTLSTSQKENWRNYAKQTVWNIWHHESANWGSPEQDWKGEITRPWSGWSVNDPVNNYYYSFLQATLLLALATHGEDSETENYLEFFRTTKIQEQLVPIFEAQLLGGGSREGTGYGTAMKNLFRLYYIWQVTTGERIADLTPHAFETMAYELHAIMPTRNRLAPIGDHARDSTASFFDYHRELLLLLTALYPNTPLAARVSAELPTMEGQDGVKGQMRFNYNYIWDFLYEDATTAQAVNLNTVYHASGTGHIFARSSWSEDATWLGFLTGAYSQSHAHKDGLSILLYKNDWLVHDLNMNSSSGIEQAMNMHAMIQLEDFEPSERPDSSAELTALKNHQEFLYMAANSGTLYTNPDVAIDRQVLWFKPNTVIVYDRASLESSSASTTATFYLPLASPPQINTGTVTLNANTTLFWVDPNPATPQLVPVFDAQRLELSSTHQGTHRFLTVFSLDDTVESVVAAGGSGGVNITFKNGEELRVQFQESATGLLEFQDINNQVILSKVLDSGVESLPLGE